MKVTPSIDDDVKGPFIVRKLPKYSIEKAAASWRRSPKSRFYYIILHTKKTCKIDPSVSDFFKSVLQNRRVRLHRKLVLAPLESR